MTWKKIQLLLNNRAIRWLLIGAAIYLAFVSGLVASILVTFVNEGLRPARKPLEGLAFVALILWILFCLATNRSFVPKRRGSDKKKDSN